MRKRSEDISTLSMQEAIAQGISNLSDSEMVRLFVPENGVLTQSELAVEFVTEDKLVSARTSYSTKPCETAKKFMARVGREMSLFVERAKKAPAEEVIDDSLLCSLLMAAGSVASAFSVPLPDGVFDEMMSCPRVSNRLLVILVSLFSRSCKKPDFLRGFMQEISNGVKFERPLNECFQDPRCCFPHAVSDFDKDAMLIEDIAETEEVQVKKMSIGNCIASILLRLPSPDTVPRKAALYAKVRRACSAVCSVEEARWFSILYLQSFSLGLARYPSWIYPQVNGIILDVDPLICSNAFLKYELLPLCMGGDLLPQILRSFSLMTNDGVSPAFSPFMLLSLFRNLRNVSASTVPSVLSSCLLLLSVKSPRYYDSFSQLLKYIRALPSGPNALASRDCFESVCALLHQFMDPVVDSISRTGNLVNIKNVVSFPVTETLISCFRKAMHGAQSVSALMQQTDLLEKVFIPILNTDNLFPIWNSSILMAFSVILNSDPSQFPAIKAMRFMDVFAHMFCGIDSFIDDNTILAMPHVIQALAINSEGQEFCQRSSFVQQVLDVIMSHRVITWNEGKFRTLGGLFASLLTGIDCFMDSIVTEINNLLENLLREMKALHCKPRDKTQFQAKYDSITNKKLLAHVNQCRLDEATGLHTHYNPWPRQPVVPCSLCRSLDELCGLKPDGTSPDFIWATRFSAFLNFLACVTARSRGAFQQALLNKGVFSTLLKPLESVELPSVCSMTSIPINYEVIFNIIAPRMQFSSLVECFTRIVHSSEEWKSKSCVKDSVESHMPLFRSASIMASTMSSVTTNTDAINDSTFVPLFSGTGGHAFSELCQMRQFFIAFDCAGFPKPPQFTETMRSLNQSVEAFRAVFLECFRRMFGGRDDLLVKLLNLLKNSISSDVASITTLRSRVAGTKEDIDKVLFNYVDRIISGFAMFLFHNDTIDVYVVDNLRQSEVTREIFRVLVILFGIVKSGSPELGEWIISHNNCGFYSLLEIAERLCDEKTIMESCKSAGRTRFWSASSLPDMVAQFHKEAGILESFMKEPAALFSLGPHIVQKILRVIMLSHLSSTTDSSAKPSSSSAATQQAVPDGVFEQLRVLGFERTRLQAAANLCHSSDAQEIMDYMLSHMEEVSVQESILVSKQEEMKDRAPDPKPSIVTKLLELRRAAPKQFKRYVDDALMPICSQKNVINCVADDILSGPDGADLKYQFLYMTISKWTGSVSTLNDLVRKNGIISSLSSGLRELLETSPADVSSPPSSPVACSPSLLEPSDQLVKCLSMIIKRDFGFNDSTIADIDRVATTLTTGDAAALRSNSVLFKPEEKEDLVKVMCAVLLRCDFSQVSIVPFIDCLGMLSLDANCAAEITKILTPNSIVECFAKNSPNPTVLKRVIELVASATCRTLFAQAPNGEMEHMIRRFFINPSASVSMVSLINHYGPAVRMYPGEFFNALKKSTTVQGAASSLLREKPLRYSGSLNPVEENDLPESCLAAVDEHVKTLVSILIGREGETMSYFKTLLACSLLTSICVAHPSAVVALRHALGPVTLSMMKTLFSALVISYSEIPFDMSFGLFLSVLIKDEHDRDECVKAMKSLFSEDSESVTFEDVALLAGICQAVYDLRYQDDDAFMKNISVFAQTLLKEELPQILFAKLHTLHFRSFEDRMFIPACLNIVSSLAEVSKFQDVSDPLKFMEFSALMLRFSSRLQSWQPDNMKPSVVLTTLSDHAIVEQAKLSRNSLPSSTSGPRGPIPSSGSSLQSGRFLMNALQRLRNIPDARIARPQFHYAELFGGDRVQDASGMPIDFAELFGRDLGHEEDMEEYEEDGYSDSDGFVSPVDEVEEELEEEGADEDGREEDEEDEEEDDSDEEEDDDDEERERDDDDDSNIHPEDVPYEQLLLPDGVVHPDVEQYLDDPSYRHGFQLSGLPGDEGFDGRRLILQRLSSHSSKVVFCSFEAFSRDFSDIPKDVAEVFSRALRMHVAAVQEAERQEQLRKKEEEKRRKAEEERQRKEREEEEARRKAAAEAQQAQPAMTDSDPAAAAAAPASEPTSEIDFASFGIDPQVFADLPPEMQQEILADIRQQQQAQQPERSPQSSQQNGQLDEAFLAELPPDLREECLRDFQEYNRRQEAASQRRPDEDISLTIAMLPPEARRDALLSLSEDVIATLPPGLQEEAAELRGGRDMGGREVLLQMNIENIRCKQKIIDRDGLSSVLRVMYLEDTKEFKKTDFLVMINGFLRFITPSACNLLMNNLYLLLVPARDSETVAAAVTTSSDIFDPFNDPYHPSIVVSGGRTVKSDLHSSRSSSSVTAGAATAAAATAAAAAGGGALSDSQKAGSSSSHLEDIARLVLTFLGQILPEQRHNTEYRFENFPLVLDYLLRFALTQSRGSNLLDRAMKCVTVNLNIVDMSKQPPIPKELFSVICQLLEEKFELHEVVLKCVDSICVTPESRRFALQELKRVSSKLRCSTHRIMQDYTGVVSGVLQPCVDFVQKCDSMGSSTSKEGPEIDMSKLQLSKTSADVLEQFSTFGMAMSSIQEKLDPEMKSDDETEMTDEADMVALWDDLDNIFSILSSLKSRTSAVENSGIRSSYFAKTKLACSSVLTPLLPLVRVYFSSHAFIVKNASSNSLRTSSSHVTTTLSSSSFFKTTSSGSLLSMSSSDEDAKKEKFLSFCDKNRALLNEYVRENPDLLRNELQCLLKMPRVLEFDTKLAWFRRKLRLLHSEVHVGHMNLNVKRDRLFMDSYNQISHMRPQSLRGRLHVTFDGEEGYDAGGLTREWYHVISREMFNQDYALFIASDDGAFQPNSASSVNPDHLLFFNFIGRVVGKALWDGELLDAHFTRSFYKHILGQEVTFKDLEAMDNTLYRSLNTLLEEDMEDLTFVINDMVFGRLREVELKPGGANIDVTPENKQEYVRLYTQYKLSTSIHDQIDAFLRGFHDLIPADLVAPFTESELELLISGTPEIDVEDLRRNTEYQHYQPSSPQIVWFWRFVESLSREEKAKLLQFVTGTGKVPLGGFADLPGMGGVRHFTISRSENARSLPTAHTCFNQLDLPAYDSYDTLRNNMLLAINEGCGEFGFM